MIHKVLIHSEKSGLQFERMHAAKYASFKRAHTLRVYA